jgi:hypothetical protein
MTTKRFERVSALTLAAGAALLGAPACRSAIPTNAAPVSFDGRAQSARSEGLAEILSGPVPAAAPRDARRAAPEELALRIRVAPDANDPELPRPSAGAVYDEAPWRFVAVGYLWAPEIHGTTSAGVFSVDLDVSQADAFDEAADLHMGFVGHIEALHGGFGFYVDANYLDLRADQTAPTVGAVNTSIQQGILEGGFLGRMLETRIGPGDEANFRLDSIFGIRYTTLDIDIDVPSLGTSGHGMASWFEPIFGARVLFDLTDKIHLLVRGDIGGYDDGSSSDFTWGAEGAASFSLTAGLELAVGYRILDVDYHEDFGVDFDVQYRGPWLGLVLRF